MGTETKGEFARRRGVGARRISYWIRRGVISGRALTADGLIDIAEAERQLANMQPTQRGRPASPAGIRRPSGGDQPPLSLDEQWRAQRIAEGELRLDRLRREAGLQAGQYMLTGPATASWARELAGFIETVKASFVDLAASLSPDKAHSRLVILRKWWRDLRSRSAASASARAAKEPKFVEEDPARPGYAAPGVREKILEIDLEQKRRRLMLERGVYVLAADVRAQQGKAFSQFVAACDAWIEGLAELTPDQVAAVRVSWRRFREREAEAMRRQAEALPEFVVDVALTETKDC